MHDHTPANDATQLDDAIHSSKPRDAIGICDDVTKIAPVSLRPWEAGESMQHIGAGGVGKVAAGRRAVPLRQVAVGVDVEAVHALWHGLQTGCDGDEAAVSEEDGREHHAAVGAIARGGHHVADERVLGEALRTGHCKRCMRGQDKEHGEEEG